jgi:acyl transferase domain-containing protein
VSPSSPIAVVGTGALFPGAADAHAFWEGIVAGRDAITEVPPGRWDPLFYDPTSEAVDRVYAHRGGLLPDTVPIDLTPFGLMPVAASGAEPDQLLALHVAGATLHDAELVLDAPTRARTAVILGRGSYVTAGMVRLDQKVRGAQQVISLLRQLAPGLSETLLAELKAELQAQAGTFGPDTAIGLVPNLTASRIANRFDLQGPAYTVDAACASSLIAVEHAVRELRAGRVDLALAGGVHTTQDITFWSVFSQLGALSRSQQIRPFSQHADGLLIGEGVGMVALMRLQDAITRGCRVLAVLTGVGSASDGRGSSVMVPRVEGQLLALQRAWEDAGADPAQIGLIEAHGTATPAGDSAELLTLGRFFGSEGPRIALGSVKSMIGHAMPAAGIAGLIKAVHAVHHRVLPPSLHAEQPHPALAQTRCVVHPTASPWPDDLPRRAAVSAFGFGGINAHVVLEAAPEQARASAPRSKTIALAADSPEALLAALDRGETRGGQGRWRLGILHAEARTLDRARKAILRRTPWRGRGGIWFSGEGLGEAGGVVALFPGVEPRFAPDAEAIARAFDLPVPRFSRPENLEQTGMGLVEVGRLLLAVLGQLGVPIAAHAGHSVGEWTAMFASGLIPEEQAEAVLSGLSPGSLEVPGVLFAAAACGVEVATAALHDLPDISVSHDNCPRQVLLCGVDQSVYTARDRLLARDVIVQVLPFRSGFHSPLLAPFTRPHRELLSTLPLGTPHTPMWSATTCAPFPEAPEEVRTLAARHLVEPVRFRELALALHEAGHRVFVQLGPGSLTGFLDDALGDRPHLAVSALDGRLAGLDQLRSFALALFSEGVPVDLDRLLGAARPQRPLWVDIDLRTPLLSTSRTLPLHTARPPLPEGPVLAAFDRALGAAERARDEVLTAWTSRRNALRRRTTRRTLSLQTDPWLIDHSFFPQPEGWPDDRDRYPLVPMTMLAELMWQAAAELAPERTPVRMEQLAASKWLTVVPPAVIDLTAEEIGPDRVQVEIEGYARAIVQLAASSPTPPAPRIAALKDGVPAPLTPERLYGERWMFHGPAYQGITGLGPWSEAGIEGVIRTPAAPGALLDNAGQVFGYWLMAAREVDRLALPVQLDRIERYGPHPAEGELLTCRVAITAATAESLTCDLELIASDGRVWCRIEGWTDRRFPNDPQMWRVMRQPEHHLICDEGPGWVLLHPDRRRVPSRDWVLRCFLTRAERAELRALGPRHQRTGLNTRLAAKDAVRRALGEPLFPSEIQIAGNGQAIVRGQAIDLWVRVATDQFIAVAAAAPEKAPLLGMAVVAGAAARLGDPSVPDDLPAARHLAARDALAAEGEIDTSALILTGAVLRLGSHTVSTHHDGDLVIAWSPP